MTSLISHIRFHYTLVLVFSSPFGIFGGGAILSCAIYRVFCSLTSRPHHLFLPATEALKSRVRLILNIFRNFTLLRSSGR